MRCVWQTVLAVAALCAPASALELAVDGVREKELRLGQVAALEGPVGRYGSAVQQGLFVCFQELNHRGGVHGRQVRFVALDDGYRPDRAVEGALKLVEENEVFALLGATGTPCSRALTEWTNRRRVPLVGMFTPLLPGAEPGRYAFQIRPQLSTQIEALVEQAVTAGATPVAVVHADDELGRAGATLAEAWLRRRNASGGARAVYTPGTATWSNVTAALRTPAAQSVILIGASGDLANACRAIQAAGLTPRLSAVTLGGAGELAKALAESGLGVTLAEPMPEPNQSKDAVVQDYLNALHRFAPKEEPSAQGLEGYVIGRIVVLALEKTGRDLTREAFVDTLERMKEADLGGWSVTYGESDRQGLDPVYLARTVGGAVKMLEKPVYLPTTGRSDK